MPIEATVKSVDERGYQFDETSELWKQACLALPSFAAVWWPDYETQVVEDVIDGQPVVIQLWKGWCQKFLGDDAFPGGVGAEVAVYHRVPGKVPPADLSFLPAQMASFLLDRLATLGGDRLWWPFPELNARIDFELVNPKTNETFFRAGPEQTYWMNRWMGSDSYEKYKAAQGGQVPLFSAHYKLKYRINGKQYEW